jgi:hypothetical protein
VGPRDCGQSGGRWEKNVDGHEKTADLCGSAVTGSGVFQALAGWMRNELLLN